MDTCKTCKYWEKDRPGGYIDGQGANGHSCLNRKLRDLTDESPFSDDALVYEPHDCEPFWTGPDFGCIHHKPAG